MIYQALGLKADILRVCPNGHEVPGETSLPRETPFQLNSGSKSSVNSGARTWEEHIFPTEMEHTNSDCFSAQRETPCKSVNVLSLIGREGVVCRSQKRVSVKEKTPKSDHMKTMRHHPMVTQQ